MTEPQPYHVNDYHDGQPIYITNDLNPGGVDAYYSQEYGVRSYLVDGPAAGGSPVYFGRNDLPPGSPEWMAEQDRQRLERGAFRRPAQPDDDIVAFGLLL